MLKIFKTIRSLFPSKLPQGMTEFETWAKDIIELAGIPDNDSTRFAVAVSILHLDATSAFKPKHYFVKTLIKGAASQVAGGVMQELKEKQQAAVKAEQEKQLAEATAQPAVLQDVASNGEKA